MRRHSPEVFCSAATRRSFVVVYERVVFDVRKLLRAAGLIATNGCTSDFGKASPGAFLPWQPYSETGAETNWPLARLIRK